MELFCFDGYGGLEICVQGGEDLGGMEVGCVVYVGQGVGGGEVDEGGKVVG